MSAIAANTNVPVSVKCRIGVDDHDSYDELCKAFRDTLLRSILSSISIGKMGTFMIFVLKFDGSLLYIVIDVI